MNKRLVSVAVLATAALGLTACSSGDAASDAAGDTLTVWIMKGTNTNTQEFYDRVGAAFTEKTGATVEIEEVQWADAHDRFVTAIAGGTTPDVAETGTTWTAEFAASGALAPIGDYVDEAGLSEDLVQGLVEAGTYEEELYGMPWYAGVRSIVYRADVFEELGIEEPKNWDELVAAGEKIKAAKPNMMPFAVPGDAEQALYPWVWGAGGEVATEQNGTWTSGLDSAESREGIDFYTSLALEHDFSSAGATTWKETDLLDNFAQESVAMAIMGSWTPSAVLEKNPALEGKIAAMPIPGKDGGISPAVLGGSHMSVFDTAEDKDLAFEFVELITTGEFAQEWADSTGYFPGQQSLMEAATESDDPLVQSFAVQMVDGGASLPVTPAFASVQAKKTSNTMLQSILSRSKTVDQATSDAAVEMTELLNAD